MKIDFDNIPLISKEYGDKKRFELEVEGKTAFMDYMISKLNIIYLTHTEVPKALEGKGVGKAIVQKVLQYISTTDMKMAPLCPFVAAYLVRHPEEAKGILAPGYKVG